GRQPSQKCPIGLSIVVHSHRGFHLSCFVHSDEQRIFLMCITTDKMLHAATPPMVFADRGIWSTNRCCSAFIQSSWIRSPSPALESQIFTGTLLVPAGRCPLAIQHHSVVLPFHLYVYFLVAIST